MDRFPAKLLCGFLLALCRGIVSQPAQAMQFVTGSYVGNGTAGRSITGVGFQPDAVIIKGNAAQHAVMRTSTMTGDAAKQMGYLTTVPALVRL